MKNTVILVSGVLLLALSGCAGSFSKVREAVDRAPDWYEGRRDAASKEGYPELTAVPEPTERRATANALELSKQEIAKAKTMFESDPRAADPDMTADELRRFASRINRNFAAGDVPREFLTDEEIRAIREGFNIGRAKLIL